MRRLALFSVIVVGCFPAPPGNDGGTTGSSGSTSTGGDSSSTTGPTTTSATGGGGSTESGGGLETGDGTGSDPNPTNPDPSGATTTGMHETSGGPVGPFACPGARWVFAATIPGQAQMAAVDPRGHVLLGGWAENDAMSVRDIDADGELVYTVTTGPGDEVLAWGGVDAASNWYLAYRRDDTADRGVRKFDTTGALVWERGLGPTGPEDIVPALAVAPNGSTVMTEWFVQDVTLHTRLFKHDAAGALVWQESSIETLQVLALNDTGAMAGTRFSEWFSEVVALAPDATTKWALEHSIDENRWAEIDVGGEVVFATGDDGPGFLAERFATGGAVIWQKELTPTGDPGDWIDSFDANASGQIAVAGEEDDTFSAFVAKYDAAGELMATHTCGPSFGEPRALIDDAGAVYLIGGALIDDVEQQFVAVFD